MKTITKSLLTLLTIVLLFSSAFAQKYLPDSIHVRIDNKMEITISSYGYDDLWSTIKPELVSLQSIISSNGNFENYSDCAIVYIPGKSFTITPSIPEEIIRINNGIQTNYNFTKKCEVSSSNYSLLIRFNDFNDILQESFIMQIEQAIDSSAAVNARYAGVYDYTFNGKQLIENNVSRSDYGQSDVMLLKGGIGVGLFKNQPMTDISAVVAFSFSKKGILRNEFYISDNLIFNYSANNDIYTNNFLNLGYRINISRNIKSANWIGIEAGYLITRNGDFFDKNTFRFGFNWELGKSISVAPQLYFSGDLSRMYPGLRIGFGF